MAAQGSTRVVLAAMAANFGIAVAKLAAATYTGSSAILSEAVHSLIDTSNQGLLLYGMKRAARPADARHPFGYAKELYFWSFIVAILLFSMGAGVAIYEGVEKLKHPHPVTSPHVNYIVLGVAILLEAGSCWVALQQFNVKRNGAPFLAALRASKDAALVTVLLEDLAAMAGLVIALAGVTMADIGGVPEGDGIASIAIGLVLAFVAAFIAIEVKSLLTGEAASDELQAGVRDIITTELGPRNLGSIGELKTMQLGASSVLVAATLDVSNDLSAAAIEAMNTKLERSIKARFPDVRHIYLEVASTPAGLPALETKSAAPPASTSGSTTATPGHKPHVTARHDGNKGRGKRRR